MRPIRLLILLTGLLGGCGGLDLPPIAGPVEGAYQLDSGERVRIIVYGQTEMSGVYMLNDGGFVSLPLIGQLQARGLSVQQLEQSIKDKLRAANVMVDPSVSVEVDTYRPFYILGEVMKPGLYPYINRMTVLTAVAIAGGFTDRARTDKVSITRNVGERSIEGVAGRTTQVVPGDVIVVHDRFF